MELHGLLPLLHDDLPHPLRGVDRAPLGLHEDTEARGLLSILVITVIIIIIVTRPMPAYGRQGLAVSWGQNTDEVSTFLVFLASHYEPPELSSD